MGPCQWYYYECTNEISISNVDVLLQKNSESSRETSCYYLIKVKTILGIVHSYCWLQLFIVTAYWSSFLFLRCTCNNVNDLNGLNSGADALGPNVGCCGTCTVMPMTV